MQCDICHKEFKGKIGVGVHLKRSHTREERCCLWMKHLLDILPVAIAIIVFIGSVPNSWWESRGESGIS